MKLLYFPGCALKSTATELEKSTLALAGLLGTELVELNKWYCCGVVHNLAVDSEMCYVASARNLSKAQVMSKELNVPQKLVTVCSMCYSTLKHSNLALKSDPDRLEKVNKFMDTEKPYKGEVEVIHFLELLKDSKSLEKHVKRPLKGLKVAPYYGCVLLRPKETSITDPNNPEIFENLIASVGGTPISYPKRDECCGSYQTALSKEITLQRCSGILRSAEEWDANLMVATCPLCHFNLELSREEAEKKEHRKLVPTLYLTELLSYALGLDEALTRESMQVMDSLTSRSSNKGD